MNYIKPHMLESFSKHELAEVEAGPSIRYFQMRRPGTPIYSVELLFVGRQIFIAGDIRIGPTGSVIARGYDLGWFTSKLDGDYLCEKFLPKRRPGSGIARQHWDADAGWLSVVQQTFRDLYAAQVVPQEVVPA